MEQIELRNTEIIQKVNDDILSKYKVLKKDLATQKDGKVNETIISRMREVMAKTEELANEVELRMPEYSVDAQLIRSLETFNSPLEYEKQKYIQIQNNQQLQMIQKIQTKANLAISILQNVEG